MQSYRPKMTGRPAKFTFWLVFLWPIFFWSNLALPDSITVISEENWLDQASSLILAAQSAKTDARQFNKDVRESRVRIRKIMQQARKVKLSAEHNALHSTMVLLDVLLKSAAACQTAGYIVCPPMLMTQLKIVQKNCYANLEKVKQALNISSAGPSM